MAYPQCDAEKSRIKIKCFIYLFKYLKYLNIKISFISFERA